ncbi:MAG: PD-(D/E)XK nuclease family protein [Planctomycetaceae bacterium]|nr:PD-(D/E)XK nuclease family protein [Planctomycetaceae bacterium]
MTLSRHFLDWNQPALPAAADYLIQRFATDSTLDLSRVTLVLPGRRAARRIVEILLQKAGDRYPDWLPPQTVTFERLPELLYRQQLELADDLTQLLVWRQALYSIPAAELAAALPHIPDKDSPTAWMSLCQTLRRQHNELASDDMEFDEVAQALADSGHVQESARWLALRRIQAEYLMRMDQLQLWDRQLARLIAVQQNECQTDRSIILIGTVDMNVIVRRMLEQVADSVTALIHAPESQSHLFDSFGCLNVDEWQERLLDIPLEVCRIADNPAGQAAAVVQDLAELPQPIRPDDITIGVADDSLVPPILQELADASVHGHWPVGMTYADSRPFRLLAAAARHLGTARQGSPPDFFTLSDFIRHPDVFRFLSLELQASELSLPDEDWLTELDRYLSIHLQNTPGGIAQRNRRSRIVEGICQRVDQLFWNLLLDPDHTPSPEPEATPAPSARRKATPGRQRQLTLDDQAEAEETTLHMQLGRKRQLTDWTDGVLRLLEVIYGSEVFDPAHLADRATVAGVQALQQLCHSLHSIPESIVPRCTGAQALQLLLRITPDDFIAPDNRPDALDVVGWLELPMDDAPVLILSGFNEGAIPESVTSDVFLPNSLRSTLGLTDNRRRYARDAYIMTTLLNSRRRLTVISGRADAQGNPLAPSRLWFAAKASSLPERVRTFYQPPSDETAPSGGPWPQDAQLRMDSDHQSRFTLPAPDPTVPAPTELSVTAFRDYLHCPYRYFLKHELKLRTIEDDVRELSAAAFGSLLHEVLNRFGDSSIRHTTSVRSIEEFLLNELKSRAIRRFGRTRSATVTVQLQMAEARLSAFASRQAEQAQQGWRIHRTEEQLTCDDFTDLYGRRIALKGRVDRIDRHHRTGEWRVLDYKTGDTTDSPERSHQKKEQWIDLQLPLYQLLVSSDEITGDVQLGYVTLPGDPKAGRFVMANWTPQQLREAELLARKLAADILDLRIDRVAPGADMRYSELARVCQDTVIDRNIPWLSTWTGRSGALRDEGEY